MELYEGGDCEPWGAYGYNLAHKHIPEMTYFSGLETAPVFMPSVGNFAQGMVVSVPLHCGRDLELAGEAGAGEAMHAALAAHYAESTFVEVMPLNEEGAKSAGLLERDAFLRPDTLNDSNNLQLFVFSNEEAGTAVLVARLDNLGKGASGAAVQNLNLALGLGETTGL
uniref:N-acetyl-gamma-glutamyl-phosphate reductase dimerisation domain-containing protein n=1 Tax=Octactis speculum TaxID=3111310 RepID=A0A7S2HRR6_9STRA|mmetsp:Transcript_8839/g.11255  ORF Transcript_8839/g.11255 Transcript_8839/m.11255 type:complete len:168 (+) Transcript_8839:532-1035(+)